MIRVKVDGTREMKQVVKRLEKAATGTTGRTASRNLVRASQPVQRQIKAAVKAVDVGSSRGGAARPNSSTHLRARVAAAVNASAIADGVAIFIQGWMLGANGSRLAQYLDTEDLPRWRHPVFGRRARWETSTGQPYFYVTIRGAEPQFADAVDDACDETAQEICR